MFIRDRFNEQLEKWETEVEAREEQARVDKLVHKLEVEKWFIKVSWAFQLPSPH
jgi:hypothetical protein